jgi:hypothetical protein
MNLSLSGNEEKANSVICQAAVFDLGSQVATSCVALIHCRSAPQHRVFGCMMSDIASKIGRIRLRYENPDQGVGRSVFLADRHYQVDVNIYM